MPRGVMWNTYCECGPWSRRCFWAARERAKYQPSVTRSIVLLIMCAVFSSGDGVQELPRTSFVQNVSSIRTPSATLALLVVSQIQFLATLSLVDSTGAEDSLFLKFAGILRFDISLRHIELFREHEGRKTLYLETLKPDPQAQTLP